MTRLVVLDCEAVQALRDPGHPKHRRVVSHAQVVADRKRRAVAIQMVVPTAVRVEAGWDRTSPAWVLPNRLRIADSPLDTASASTAAGIRDRTGVSVADSHIGAVIQSAPEGQVTVVTSDPGDMRRVAGDRNITVATV
jgi:predicted nucleic acid-binding protein